MFLHKSFSRKSFAPASWAPTYVIEPPIVIPAVAGGGGGGGGAHGVDPGKELTTLFGKNFKLPSAEDFEYEERIRAEIIREDEEILMVIMSAITTGAMKKWLH